MHQFFNNEIKHLSIEIGWFQGNGNVWNFQNKILQSCRRNQCPTLIQSDTENKTYKTNTVCRMQVNTHIVT